VTHTFYRRRVVEGRTNVSRARAARCSWPTTWPTWTPFLLIAPPIVPSASLMDRDIYEHPLVKPFAKVMGRSPFHAMVPRELIHSPAARATLSAAARCCHLRGRTDEAQERSCRFARGMERIMKERRQPHRPRGPRGLWGSIFSFERGPAASSGEVTERLHYTVAVGGGELRAGRCRTADQRTEGHAGTGPVQRGVGGIARRAEHLGQALTTGDGRPQPSFRFAMADGQDGGDVSSCRRTRARDNLLARVAQDVGGRRTWGSC